MKTVPVLQLSPIHHETLRRHFLALPAEDLRLRFEHALCEAALLRYVDSIDFDRDVVFGVFDDKLELAGVAHLGLTGKTAEFGVSVLPGSRGRGIGTALFRRAFEYTRNHAIGTLFMHCLKENEPMLRIARRSGMEIVLDAAEAEARLRVPPGDPESFAGELLEERIALFDLSLKWQHADLRVMAAAAQAVCGRALADEPLA
jgi:RimJ/RimL family protein N-acetyltransferase